MVDDYGYINGRIRILRTELLAPRTLEELSAASSYAEFLRQLSETALAEDLRETTAQGAGLPELDAALSRNFHRTARKVLSFTDGEPRGEIGVLLAKWDLTNLKTLGRGVMKGRSSETIGEAFIPGGTLSLPLLQTASTASDLLGAAQTLSVGGGPLARVFREAAQAFVSSGDPMDFEVSLDQGYYKYALSTVKSTSLRSYLAREIDVRNALSSRQLRGAANPGRYFVPGGSFSDLDFARMASGDASVVNSELSSVLEALTLEEADTASRRLLDRAASSAAISDALGPGLALDYLRRKEIEVATVRLIARGKFYNVPQEGIRRELGYV